MADEDARLNEDLRRKPAFIERVHLADVILNPKLVKTLYPTAAGSGQEADVKSAVFAPE